MISCEWDMLLNEIPLEDLKIMGAQGQSIGARQSLKL